MANGIGFFLCCCSSVSIRSNNGFMRFLLEFCTFLFESDTSFEGHTPYRAIRRR
jgi:hypothetical protein